MLTQLHIRNFAVVKTLDIEFEQGMTAITGETGAGKSIALDALGLCLGDRADADSVRAGAEKSEVSACFHVQADSPAQQWLIEQEVAAEDECVLRRVVTREGRSKAWINGHPVTAAQLKSIGPWLVNIHGQHEHQLLTREEHQLKLLDNYARHNQLTQAVAAKYEHWYQQRKALRQAEQQQEELAARRELLQYQVQELDEFALAEDEFETLEEQHKRLANSQSLREESSFALNALFEGEHNNAFSLIQNALERLREQVELDPQLQSTVDLLTESSVQVEEVARELRNYQDNIDNDPERLVIVEQRMTQALQLARKHQVEPAKLTQKHQTLNAELSALADAQEQNDVLAEQVQQAAAAYREQALQLSKSRTKAAQELSDKIAASMQQLNMPHGRFVISVEHRVDAPATRHGTDAIQFLVTANPGQPLQPLAKIASGGELSRISLAVQVITAAQQTTPTLMFDEVDVGVSGPTAATVGKLLRQLGSTAQVICVTHLPQVAAKAHQQMMVAKQTDGSETTTTMTPLTNSDRVIELARLLGGDKVTDTTKANAEELLAG
ncbi:DNA replication and repair protein RecN [Pseudidiomarina planktonica]|uniref:DNA repair protein RecN n=1 Tax=Pseudidiomarina planktonica TaxID=1323738 RepID=A0A1Y6ELH6_9GAMM|nr:DNA repair protein RecN [Pseudidiomarina planktonica]RUO65690.1 DNA repair protein RecN [Pseudidiomarina planktonica]SMQ63494.1 DNA replication and repair protein RecN [Pseudidiomarina planktonica]